MGITVSHSPFAIRHDGVLLNVYYILAAVARRRHCRAASLSYA